MQESTRQLEQFFFAGFKPSSRLTLSEWSDQYRQLSPEDSAEPGQWETSRAPYLQDIMDAWTDPSVHTVVVKKGTQVGFTQLLLNAFGYHVHQDPGPILLVMPELEAAREWSKQRLEPMIRDNPEVLDRVGETKSRSSKGTIRSKSFPGGYMALVGANVPSGLASRPIRILLADEVDRWQRSAGAGKMAEGDPLTLARQRQTNFWNAKTFIGSSPGIKGASVVEREYEASDKAQRWVPCWKCGSFQVLNWAQVKYDKDANGKPVYASARYQCCEEECKASWTDQQRWDADQKGEWRSQRPREGIAGFDIPQWYSPWIKLADVVKQWHAAQGDPYLMQVFVNTVMAETWEDRGETVDHHALHKRAQAEKWEKGVPGSVLVVTCGVDVQGDRLEIERVGWGLEEESWSLDHEVIYGDLSTPAPWDDLDEYLRRPTRVAGGRMLPVQATCIDSGHFTDAVYNFVRYKEGRRINAIKGMPGPGRPIWPKFNIKNNKGKIDNLFGIGVDGAKDIIFGRLRIKNPGPGYCHFPMGRDPAWYEQMTAEQAVWTLVRGIKVRSWEPKPGQRNEALDCRVYAFAALRSMVIHWGKVQRLMQEAAMKEDAKRHSEEAERPSDDEGMFVVANAAAPLRPSQQKKRPVQSRSRFMMR